MSDLKIPKEKNSSVPDRPGDSVFHSDLEKALSFLDSEEYEEIERPASSNPKPDKPVGHRGLPVAAEPSSASASDPVPSSSAQAPIPRAAQPRGVPKTQKTGGSSLRKDPPPLLVKKNEKSHKAVFLALGLAIVAALAILLFYKFG